MPPEEPEKLESSLFLHIAQFGFLQPESPVTYAGNQPFKGAPTAAGFAMTVLRDPGGSGLTAHST
jgi:hypothetical protein